MSCSYFNNPRHRSFCPIRNIYYQTGPRAPCLALGPQWTSINQPIISQYTGQIIRSSGAKFLVVWFLFIRSSGFGLMYLSQLQAIKTIKLCRSRPFPQNTESWANMQRF